MPSVTPRVSLTLVILATLLSAFNGPAERTLRNGVFRKGGYAFMGLDLSSRSPLYSCGFLLQVPDQRPCLFFPRDGTVATAVCGPI